MTDQDLRRLLSDTYDVEGVDIVMRRLHDARAERDAALDTIGRVRATADRLWHETDGIGEQDVVRLCYRHVIAQVRAALDNREGA